MHRPRLAAGLVAAATLVLCQAATATLIDRGNGMIYDTARNITWLSDADLFGTLRRADPTIVQRLITDVGTVSNGRTTHVLTTDDFSGAPSTSAFFGAMSWWGAMAFAQDLSFGGFDDWRLPTSMQPDAACSSQQHLNANDSDISYGTNCTGSELGELFYDELGGAADLDLRLIHNANFALFSNVRSDDWTGTPFVVPASGDAAWYFDHTNGEQDFIAVASTYSFAWIVRDGDVAAAPPDTTVPEPGSIALLGIGLVATRAMRRRPVARHALGSGPRSGSTS